MSLRIPSTSLEYVLVPVRVNGAAPSPSLVVEMAIVTAGTEEPAGGDWKSASWSNGMARILVGPGGVVVLTDGEYDVWVRVTSTPEIPVRKAGRLTIT